jgi:hypothetical protein
MKRSRTVLTLVLGFASTACVPLKTNERIDVVVAAADLGAGRKITDKDITITRQHDRNSLGHLTLPHSNLRTKCHRLGRDHHAR